MYSIDYGQLNFLMVNREVYSIYCNSRGVIKVYDLDNLPLANLKGELRGEVFSTEKNFLLFVRHLHTQAIVKKKELPVDGISIEKLLLSDGNSVTIFYPHLSLLIEKPLLVRAESAFAKLTSQLVETQSYLLLKDSRTTIFRSLSRYLINLISEIKPPLIFNYDPSFLENCDSSLTVEMWRWRVRTQRDENREALISLYKANVPQLFPVVLYPYTIDSFQSDEVEQAKYRLVFTMENCSTRPIMSNLHPLEDSEFLLVFEKAKLSKGTGDLLLSYQLYKKDSYEEEKGQFTEINSGELSISLSMF